MCLFSRRPAVSGKFSHPISVFQGPPSFDRFDSVNPLGVRRSSRDRDIQYQTQTQTQKDRDRDRNFITASELFVVTRVCELFVDVGPGVYGVLQQSLAQRDAVVREREAKMQATMQRNFDLRCVFGFRLCNFVCGCAYSSSFMFLSACLPCSRRGFFFNHFRMSSCEPLCR